MWHSNSLLCCLQESGIILNLRLFRHFSKWEGKEKYLNLVQTLHNKETMVGALQEGAWLQCSRKPLITPQQFCGFTYKTVSRAGNTVPFFFYSTFLALTSLSKCALKFLCFYLTSEKASLSVNNSALLSTYSGNWIPLRIIFSFSTSCSKFYPFTFLSSEGFPSCCSIFTPFFYLRHRVPVSYDHQPQYIWN